MNEIWGNFESLVKSIYFSFKNNKRDRILIIIISSILLILLCLCSSPRSTGNDDEPIIPNHTEIAGTIYSEIYLRTEIAATIYAELALTDTNTLIPTDTLFPTNTMTPTNTVFPTNTPIPIRTSAPTSNCDPSYPDVCIPSPPPDLDCDDIPYRRFRVLPPDPHGFDGDNDGVGCES